MTVNIINSNQGNRPYTVECVGLWIEMLVEKNGTVCSFAIRKAAVQAAHKLGYRMMGEDADFYNPYYSDWTQNELRNAIWDANDGRHWRGPFCDVEELRAELRQRGLSDRGYHEI